MNQMEDQEYKRLLEKQERQKIYQIAYQKEYRNRMEAKNKQKEYFRRYMEKNGSRFHSKLAIKETCKHCGRMVTHQNIPKHMKTLVCKRSVITVETE